MPGSGMMKINNPKIFLFLVAGVLTACSRAPVSPALSSTSVMGTAVAVAQTNMARTQVAVPTATHTPTPTFPLTTPSPLPSTPPTPISTYEADHEAIRQVIDAYFGKVYSMRQSFQVDGLGDAVSSSEEARGFLKTELRKQAVEVVWARMNLLRYASYHYTLDYSEIVVFDGGQRARANFTEGNRIVYELSIPSGIESRMSGVKHIMILKKEPGGWKIIYDVHDDHPHRSLYAPTPFPADVLQQLDQTLIRLNEGRGGPALPGEGKSYIAPDPVQLELWKEYETALAEKLMPGYPRNRVFCEWELMEKSAQKLNVWAVCMTTVTSAEIGNYYFPAASVPALIHLDAGGAVQNVEIPQYGENYIADFWKLVPDRIWNQWPDASAMEKHQHWRRTHPAEPPLVVLNATAILQAAPAATATAAPTPVVVLRTHEPNVWSSSGLEGKTIYCLAIDPLTPATLYAGVYGEGLFKTTDGGQSWRPADTGLTSVVIQSLVIDPNTPTTLYAGTGNSGVFKSMDGGATWQIANIGLKNSTIAALAIDPANPTTLYAGTSGGGVFKSVYGGTSWNAANTGLSQPYVSALAIDPSSSNTIYAGTLEGVSKSTDGGAHWTAASTGLAGIHVVALAIDPVTPTTIYAGTYSRGLFKSTDGGATWNAANNGLTGTDVLAVAIDPERPATLYAGTFQLGVFESTDGGASWSTLRNGMPANVVNALVIDPESPATLYAGTWEHGAFVISLVK
jgi:photosystem II stability/assembly factor-like uncharacterized protein